CVATGQFGDQGRAWCAVIKPKPADRRAGPYEVRVFYEATVAPLKDSGQTPDDLHLVFEPQGLHLCDIPRDGRRYLYLLRIAPSDAAHGNPLEIDLTTFNVRIANLQLYHGRHVIEAPYPPNVSGRGQPHRLTAFHIPHWADMNAA